MKGIIGRVLIILVLLSALALTAYIATEKFMDDKARAEELARKEKLPPTLTLEGKDTVKVRQGKKFKEPGYSAVDAFGKDLTDQVEVDVPDLKERGTYTVRYHVADKRGNTADAERTVKVDFPKQTEEGAARGLSVIMYHDVYDPEDLTVEVTPNKVSTATLEEELQFLVDEEYYFPTWKEVERYLKELEAHYMGQEGGKEIMEGIEERMAELLLERCGQGRVASVADILGIIDILGRPERIEADDPEPDRAQGKPQKKLYRDLENKRIAGVCAGVGNYFDLDPVLIRVIWALCCALAGTGLLAYIICAIVIPSDDNYNTYS